MARLLAEHRLRAVINFAESRVDRSIHGPGEFIQTNVVGTLRLLDEGGVTFSMSRASEVCDNSAMKSFFSSLKIERTVMKVYQTRARARSDVFDYIECFYNPTRRHSTLGYLSPVQFEKAQKTLVCVNATGSSPSHTLITE